MTRTMSNQKLPGEIWLMVAERLEAQYDIKSLRALSRTTKFIRSYTVRSLYKYNIKHRKSSLLHETARNGWYIVASQMCALGGDANARDAHHMTPLLHAVRSGEVRTALELIKHGADKNVMADGPFLDLGNWPARHGPPLLEAVEHRNIEMVELLLTHGAQVNQVDPRTRQRSNTALEAAIREHQSPIIELLLSHNAHLDRGGDHGLPLHVAAFVGNLDAIRILLKRGADIEAQNDVLGTPLQAAVWAERRDAVRLLLGHGANKHATGGRLGSVMNAAELRGGREILRILQGQVLLLN